MFIIAVYISAGQRFDPSHTGCDTALGNNLEITDIRSIFYMSSATEFFAVVSHGNNANGFPVLFVEKCHGAGLFGFFKRHFLFPNR